MSDPAENAGAEPAVATRWPELLTALGLAALALTVITDSLRVGTGWADDGPRSGYFPFYIGLALLGASLWTAGVQLWQWRKLQPFAERAQLRMVMAVLLPMVVYVALIRVSGIYIASALLIGYFMRRHGRHGLALTAGVALGVPLAVFAVFERWFLVPLPKGPLAALLGL
ncbi:Tripartite tricarboxylate transporter TctB family protein [Rubrivivax sp. A210]|uniref:tripartite tricarboxylate transporter TctB family protein n=1 Tax=Rubrivivax sp. A210 TaxID=2772301 RepID=UPI00191A08E7|nr:tripartite tricarboxylate transporter TctB family protein [Rubrivivax sp. A210]CAD5373679.1 Tripartite tricarboxylate transporter TctB family protein [Rubrivivax sp. A210]